MVHLYRSMRRYYRSAVGVVLAGYPNRTVRVGSTWGHWQNNLNNCCNFKLVLPCYTRTVLERSLPDGSSGI